MSHFGEKYRQTKVLISDDDAVSRLFCSQALALPGVETFVAESGTSAIRMAAAHLPDIVVMDANLHDMRGVDAIALIRQQWPHSRVVPCFVGMSADDSAAVFHAMQAAGCERVLTKPFSAQALVACMSEACHSDTGFSAFWSQPGEQKAQQQLRAKFSRSLADQLTELDEAVCRLDWTAVQQLVHRLSGAAALAGYGELAQSGRALLRHLPPAESASTVANSYVSLLQRLAEIRPE